MDDLVNRQDVIDALMNDADWADAIPTIKSLPSSEPTTKCIAQTGTYDLDKPLRFKMEWTDYVKENLPKEELLYMPMRDMRQYDWGVIIGMGERE